jgi:hypothetical protein
MQIDSDAKRKLGFLSLAASIAVLFFQQEIGEVIGVGVMALWVGLGVVGVWLLGPGPEEN